MTCVDFTLWCICLDPEWQLGSGIVSMQRFQKGTRTLFEGRLVLLISLVTNRLGSFLSDGMQDSESGLKLCTRVQGRQLEGAVISSRYSQPLALNSAFEGSQMATPLPGGQV